MVKFVPYLILLSVLPMGLLANPLRGAEALLQLDGLPCLRRGVSVHQESSYDRSGGNRDRNCWKYRDANGDYVIFDESGAGCIYRFWMTHGGGQPDYSANYATNHIKIYIDDDTVPRFESSIADFFSGSLAPFLFPLAGDQSVSSGGLYSYVPIPYRSRCRIALTDIPPASMRDMSWGPDSYWMYYNITYHTYASAENVVSWTGMEDMEPLQSMLSQTYADPKTNSTDWVFSGTVSPVGHSSEEVIFLSGTGVVNSVALDVDGLTGDQMTNLWLSIYWDDDPEPAVEAPIGEFFGAGRLPGAVVDSLLVGRDSTGTFYCYFPMPFWGNARMVLENRGTTPCGAASFSVGIGDRHYRPDDTGYFHAHHTSQSYTNRVVAPDYVMLNEAGRGHVVGISLFGAGAGKIYNNGLAYLEGDERIYIDGSLTPQLHGTGTEDYFNAGWYFNNGTFSLPLHGQPVRALPYGMGVETNYIGAYRLNIGDVIPFNESIRMGMEHGGEDEVGCTLSSVAYYYKLRGNGSGLVECAQFDVGQPEDEAVYNYATESASEMVTNTYAYTGDDHDVLIMDNGRLESTGTSFQVPIPADNDGLLLRRRIDSGIEWQSALVRVDGAPVGLWDFHDQSFSNVNQRWRDDEFYIPFGFTAGKSNVTVSFEIQPGSDAWTEYRYAVYALKPFVENGDVDADGMADSWEVAYFGNVMDALPNVDSDGDGFLDQDEYVCMTDPLNKQSFFHLMTGGDVQNVFSFDTSASRVYRIERSTNLVENAWNVVETVYGDGNSVSVPASGAAGRSAFYRVQVDMQ